MAIGYAAQKVIRLSRPCLGPLQYTLQATHDIVSTGQNNEQHRMTFSIGLFSKTLSWMSAVKRLS